MQWRGTAWLRDMLQRAETKPFYEWHAWIRAELRDLKRSTSREDEDEGEAFLAHSTSAAEVVMDLAFLSEKDISILMDSDAPASTAPSRAHVPSAPTTSKRANLRNWLLGGGGAGGGAGHIPGPMESEVDAAATSGAGPRNFSATNQTSMLLHKTLCY